MRRFLILAAIGATTTAGLVVACGIDEGGLMTDASVDVFIPFDVGGDKIVLQDSPYDVVIPPGCKTLDASACLDAGVPDGWTLVAVAAPSAACPSDYSQQDYIYDLQLQNGSCACGACSVNGRYSCAGLIRYGFNTSCDAGSVAVDAGDEAGCFPGEGDQNMSFGPLPTPTPVGVGCTPSFVGDGAVNTAPVSTCAPACTSDFCAIPSPFLKCVISVTATICPAPFVPALQSANPPGQVGPPGAVAVSCNACSCLAQPSADCTGTVTAYHSTDCTNGPLKNVPPNGSCVNMGNGTPNGVNSYSYNPQDPTVTCMHNTGSGTAGFSPPITVCCLP